MSAIGKVRYTHDAIIDVILAEPGVSQGQLAAEFGYSQTWMSIIINSDAFKERMAERKALLVDPSITASVEDRLEGMAKKSLDKLIERLDGNHPLSTGDLVRIATLGVGDKNRRESAPQVQQSLYVVNIPPPASNPAQWLAGKNLPRVEEVK